MQTQIPQETIKERLIKTVVGYDFFISYVRKETLEYARGLQMELSQQGFTCFLDKSDIIPSQDFEARIKKEVQRSKALLLVCTESTPTRPYVQLEVETLLKKRKPICLPISFQGTANNLPWEELKKIDWVVAEPGELQTRWPSQTTIEQIIRRSKFIKRMWLVRLLFIVIAFCLMSSTFWALTERNSAQAQLAYSLRDRARVELTTTNRKLRAAAFLEPAHTIEPKDFTGNVLLSDALRSMQAHLWGQKLDALPESLVVRHHTDDILVLFENGKVEKRNGVDGSLSWEVIEKETKKGAFAVASGGEYIISSSLPEASLDNIWTHMSGEYKAARLWSVENENLIADLGEGFLSLPKDIDVGNTSFATLANDMVHVYSLETGMLLQEISAPMHSDMVAISKTGDYVAVYTQSSSEHSLSIWSVASGEKHVSLDTKKDVRNLMFTLNSDAIIFTTENKAIQVWDIEKNSLRFSMTGHRRSVTDLALTPEHNLLASSSWDSSIRLWNLQTGKIFRKLVGHTDKVSHVRYSADGKLLVSTGLDGLIILWDVSKGVALLTIDKHQGEVLDAYITDDSRYIYSCGADKTLAKWDIQKASGIIRFPEKNSGHSSPYISPFGIFGAYFSGKGSPLVTNFTTKKTVSLEKHLAKSIRGIAINPRRSLLAGRDEKGNAALWDIQSGKKTIRLHEDEKHKYVHLFAFTPHGDFVAGIYNDGFCRIWDASNGEIKKEAQMHYDLPDFNLPLRLSSILTFNPDGSLLMSGALSLNPFLWKWQEKGKVPEGLESKQKQYHMLEVEIGAIFDLTFSRQGDLLALGGHTDKQGLQLWKVSQDGVFKDKKLLLGHHMHIRSLTFNNSGTLLASGSRDGSVKIWNTDTGKLKTTLAGHKGEASTLAFHPSENLIATGSWNGIIRLWDIEASHVLLQKTYHGKKKILQLEFSRDGNVLFSSGEDGQIVQWEIKQKLPSIKDIKMLMDKQATWRIVDKVLTPQESLL